MSNRQREVRDGPQPQGVDERIYWTLDTSGWGAGTPSSIAVVVKDEDGDDVTSEVTTGSAVGGDGEIALPVLHSLTAGITYRVEAKFTLGSQVLEGYFFVEAEE